MAELRELYQELIIDHGRNPRHFGILANANRQAKGFNPLCGDQLVLYLQIEDSVIRQVSFKGVGCAISMASASLMAEHLQGKTESEAIVLFQTFQAQMTEASTLKEEAVSSLGKLVVLAGVKAFPMRVKCATLAWHTLQEALSVTSFHYMHQPPFSEEVIATIKLHIIEALKQIYDPEIPINIYDLGLIYQVSLSAEGFAHIQMTLTAAACPFAQTLPGQVEEVIRNVPGVIDVKVELVWDPPWSQDSMSEAARLQLGLL